MLKDFQRELQRTHIIRESQIAFASAPSERPNLATLGVEICRVVILHDPTRYLAGMYHAFVEDDSALDWMAAQMPDKSSLEATLIHKSIRWDTDTETALDRIEARLKWHHGIQVKEVFQMPPASNSLGFFSFSAETGTISDIDPEIIRGSSFAAQSEIYDAIEKQSNDGVRVSGSTFCTYNGINPSACYEHTDIRLSW